MNDLPQTNEYNIMLDKDLLTNLSKKIKYINGISITTLLSRNDSYEKLLQLKRENYVHKYMWSINRTYRLPFIISMMNLALLLIIVMFLIVVYFLSYSRKKTNLKKI